MCNSVNASSNNHTFFQPPKLEMGKSDLNKGPDVYVESVQKSGTHLLAKITFLFGIQTKYANNGNQGWRHLAGRWDQYISGRPLRKIFDPDLKFLVLYRDPRDLIISQIFFCKTPERGKRIVDFKDFSKYTMSQLIDKSLDSENIPHGRIGEYATRLFTSLEMALVLKKHPHHNRLLLRFEDLVPTFAGGASNRRRFRIFKEICSFGEKNFSDDQIRQVMKDCWGDTTGTFRKNATKKVGQWKKYFEPRHIKLFQEKYNHLLLGLGYETDPNWHLQYLKEDDNALENKNIEYISTPEGYTAA